MSMRSFSHGGATPPTLGAPHFLSFEAALHTSLEKAINDQAAKGYRLHTITTASSGSKGMIGGGDRIQATLVVESLG